jgi:hypothetical protein
LLSSPLRHTARLPAAFPAATIKRLQPPALLR